MFLPLVSRGTGAALSPIWTRESPPSFSAFARGELVDAAIAMVATTAHVPVI